MKKDTSRNFTTSVVALFIIGSVLFSAVESVRVQTHRVKGEYRRKSPLPLELHSLQQPRMELELNELDTSLLY